MPNTKQAEKAQRQNKKRYLYNKVIRSKVKSAIKKFRDAVKNREKDKVGELLKYAQKVIDKAYSKGVIHKNNAARKKSKLALIFNKSAKS